MCLCPYLVRDPIKIHQVIISLFILVQISVNGMDKFPLYFVCGDWRLPCILDLSITQVNIKFIIVRNMRNLCLKIKLVILIFPSIVLGSFLNCNNPFLVLIHPSPLSYPHKHWLSTISREIRPLAAIYPPPPCIFNILDWYNKKGSITPPAITESGAQKGVNF